MSPDVSENEEGPMAVRIVTDSACDLPQDVCDELGIEVVSLTIRFGNEEFVDRKELDTASFWRKLESSAVLPETAAPSVGAFEECFSRLAGSGADGIVCVNLSSAMSATMQSAQVASKSLEGQLPIAVLDSKSVSMGSGMLAMIAAERAREGADLETIVREVEDCRDRQALYATLDTLEYLRKGGRIGGAQALLGSMLSIKPVIVVQDGKVEQAGKVRTRSKALRALADKLNGRSIERVAVLHSNADDIDEFIEMARAAVPDTPITVGIIGPVVGVHTGPRTMGVGWIEAK
jgi:DegV family protein with EDD domain